MSSSFINCQVRPLARWEPCDDVLSAGDVDAVGLAGGGRPGRAGAARSVVLELVAVGGGLKGRMYKCRGRMLKAYQRQGIGTTGRVGRVLYLTPGFPLEFLQSPKPLDPYTRLGHIPKSQRSDRAI